MIRLMHSYARSGGTLLNKCLSSLPETVVVSEVSPFGGGGGAPNNNPSTVWEQARDWFDIKLYEREYFSALQELDEICIKQGRHLIVREWSYINFNTHATLPGHRPSNLFVTYEGLKERGIPLKSFALLRDPADVWISRRMPSTDVFFGRYNKYLEELDAIGEKNLFTFEAFTRDPDAVLQSICEAIDLPFSNAWKNQAQFIDACGDTALNKPQRAKKEKITPLPRKEISFYDRVRLSQSDLYRTACEKSNYTPIDPVSADSVADKMTYLSGCFKKKKQSVASRIHRRKSQAGRLYGRMMSLQQRACKKLKKAIAKPAPFDVIPKEEAGVHCAVPIGDLLYHANKPYSSPFPEEVDLYIDREPTEKADVDIVIGTYRNSVAAQLVVENFLLLEKKAKVHVWLVETSGSRQAFDSLPQGERISRVYLNTPLQSTEMRTGGRMAPSNGCGLSAQIGFHFGKARYAFFSHTDMMGYKENFISFLKSKLSDDVPLASFTLRHVYPFSAGAIYDKKFFEESARADWLPLHENIIANEKLDALASKIPEITWVDAGEQLVRDALDRGKKLYVTESRGASDAWFREPRFWRKIGPKDFEGTGVQLADMTANRLDCIKNESELFLGCLGWRKSFDDTGDVMFIHRGRGTSDLTRGGFFEFLRYFNQKQMKK